VALTNLLVLICDSFIQRYIWLRDEQAYGKELRDGEAHGKEPRSAEAHLHLVDVEEGGCEGSLWGAEPVIEMAEGPPDCNTCHSEPGLFAILFDVLRVVG